MLKQLKLFGTSLIFVALFAHGAKAVTIDYNPGEVGQPVNQSFNFLLAPPVGFVVDLVFTDQKTLTWGPGLLSFALTKTPSDASLLEGVFTDGNGDPIAGTEFDGSIDGGVIDLTLASEVVWRGMRFVANFDSFNEAGYTLIWTSRPEVGVIPEPSTAILMGLGLAGLAGVRRKSTSDG
jgi:hypothetical protein